MVLKKNLITIVNVDAHGLLSANDMSTSDSSPGQACNLYIYIVYTSCCGIHTVETQWTS